ncbi:MAG: hypothetical protein U0075_06080 [Thermomicrobiales bacterium]
MKEAPRKLWIQRKSSVQRTPPRVSGRVGRAGFQASPNFCLNGYLCLCRMQRALLTRASQRQVQAGEAQHFCQLGLTVIAKHVRQPAWLNDLPSQLALGLVKPVIYMGE